MKTLLLMRHAKSSWVNSSLADHDRPLNSRGRRDAPRMGTFLNQQDLIPDVILASTARRAQDTTKGLLETLHFDGEVSRHRALYHSDRHTYLDLLSELPEGIACAMIVGHNPDMDYFLEQTCGVYEHMPTASIAVIRFEITSWAGLDEDTEGIFVNLWKPREIEI